MDTSNLTRFGELVQTAELRPLELAELHEIGAVLSEVVQGVSALAARVEAETVTLPERHVLCDTADGLDPQARLAEVGERMRRMVGLLQEVDLQARRFHVAIGHIEQIDPDVATDRPVASRG
ncbi:hypothetical protein [Planomonospora sp. ID82291]|uniref:hypothetical protein n=1 Tax=Planomonospora sp. ID82291 TaxID=2738136 RepID=UPI0018C3AD73|nr:hypothetical protein [Planomonospora sp. ID82291]MBG0813924.1 hypothetical protein [Planomonospora sp. ID82291]